MDLAHMEGALNSDGDDRPTVQRLFADPMDERRVWKQVVHGHESSMDQCIRPASLTH